MYQNQPPLQARAEDMARYGRYGDSMLVHMNPAEVQGIAALSPTGKLTINPVTGQPEAFLPFLAPILGSMFGSSLLAGSTLGGILGGAGLSSAAAGAIGSGLATTAVTGDLKKGLLSGITGFGLGQALGAAGDALNPEIIDATAALGDASTAAAEAGKNLALTAGEVADPVAEAIKNAGNVGTSSITGTATNQALQMSPAISSTSAEGIKNAANAKVADLSGQIDSLRLDQTAGDRFLAPFKQPGAFGKALMKPANLAAVGVGEGKIAEIEARELAEEDNKRFERDREAEYQRARDNMSGAYDQLESDYAYRGYEIPRYSMGGVTSINPSHYAESIKGLQQLTGEAVQMFNGGEIFNNLNFGNSGPTGSFGSAQRQSGIRGPRTVSAEELEGTRPGFDAEITYFREPLPAEDTAGAEDATSTPTGDSNYGVDLSGVDFSNLDFSKSGLGAFNQQINDYLSTPEGNATIGSIDQVLNNQEASAQSPVNPEYNYSAFEDIGNEPSINYDDILAETARTVGNNTPPAAMAPPPSPVSPPVASMPMPRFDQREGIASLMEQPSSAPPPPAPMTPPPAPMTPPPAGMPMMPPPSINSPVNNMIGTLGGRGIGPDGLGTAGPRVYKDSGDVDLEALRDSKTSAPSSRRTVKENDSFSSRRTKKGRGVNMAEGGELESMPMSETLEANGQLLIERAVQAISGQLSEEESSAIIASFVDQFGPEAFQMLREKVLEEIVPGSQKQGEIVGVGGGMDDMVPGMIGNSQPVAVSPGEYIIPADVVSGLGDGSTDAGVGELDQMLDRVRQERTGTLRQPAPMSIGGVLPA